MTDKLARGNDLAKVVTKAFESVGLLNKGSAAIAAGDEKAKEEASDLPVSSNSLNVTRVGGTGAVIAAAGAAALALFNVDKGTDKPAIVVAAYASTGAIVAAALVTTAIIISADIKARSSATPVGVTSKAPAAAAATPTDRAAFKEAWGFAIDRLQSVKVALPAADRSGASVLWLDAKATVGFTAELTPPEGLADEHARMSAAQTRGCELLETLITKHLDVPLREEFEKLVDEARNTWNQIN
jgi:hypothetical protein